MTEALLLFQFFALLSSQSLMDLGGALLFLLGAWMIARDWARANRLREPLLAGVFATWLLGLGLGLWFSGGVPRLSALLEFRWMIEIPLWAYLLARIEWTEKHGRFFLGILGLAVGAALLSFLVQRPLFDEKFRLVLFDPTYDYPPGLPRLNGLFNNPMAFAQTYGPLSLAVATAVGMSSWRKKFFPVLVAVATLLSVALSLTRGVWLALILSAPVVFFRWGWRRALLGGFGVLILGAAFAFSVPQIRQRILLSFDDSISYDSERWTLWEANWRMFQSAPVFGVGYGFNSGDRLAQEYRSMGLSGNEFNSHAHNQLLHFLAGGGLWGALGYLSVFGLFFVWTLGLIRRGSIWPWLPWSLLVFQLCFFLGGMTEANFAIAKNRMAIVAVWAWVLALRWREREPGLARGKETI